MKRLSVQLLVSQLMIRLRITQVRMIHAQLEAEQVVLFFCTSYNSPCSAPHPFPCRGFGAAMSTSTLVKAVTGSGICPAVIC